MNCFGMKDSYILLHEGSHFGEVDLLIDLPRTTTVKNIRYVNPAFFNKMTFRK